MKNSVKVLVSIVVMIVVTVNMIAQGSSQQKIDKKQYDLMWASGRSLKNDFGSVLNLKFSADTITGKISEMVTLIAGDTLTMKVLTKLVNGHQVQSIMDFSYLGVTKHSNSNQVYEFPKMLSNGEVAFKVYFEPEHDAFSDDNYFIIVSKDGNMGLNSTEGSVRTISLR